MIENKMLCRYLYFLACLPDLQLGNLHYVNITGPRIPIQDFEFGFQILDVRFGISDFAISRFGFLIFDFRFQIWDTRFGISDFGFQISNSFQMFDFRFRISDLSSRVLTLQLKLQLVLNKIS